MWKKITDGLFAGLGIAALIEGWRRMQSHPPKPTDEEEFTRVDYLSGEYQKAFEDQENQRHRNEVQGKWCLVAGAALLAGGVALLTEILVNESYAMDVEESSSSARNENSRGSESDPAPTSVPDMSE